MRTTRWAMVAIAIVSVVVVVVVVVVAVAAPGYQTWLVIFGVLVAWATFGLLAESRL